MAKIDDVIRGLECMTNVETFMPMNRCFETKCPYRGKDCELDVMKDAMELLKAAYPEPHCLTLDELRKVNPGTVLWREDTCTVVPVEYIKIDKYSFPDGSTAQMVVFGAGMDYVCDYGKEYRLWTAKPIDEQRKAGKWE